MSVNSSDSIIGPSSMTLNLSEDEVRKILQRSVVELMPHYEVESITIKVAQDYGWRGEPNVAKFKGVEICAKRKENGA